MWYSRIILAAIQDAIIALKTKGVGDAIIQFVQSLTDNQKGRAIGALNQNPSMTINDLEAIFESGYKPSSQELEFVKDYDPAFQNWALYQYKLLRKNKLTDDPRDDRWEYKEPLAGYAGIKGDLDKIYEFWSTHTSDNPNYNIGTRSFQEAYDDSDEWQNAMAQRGSGKFYLPFERDESGKIVDEKIVYRYDDGSMMVRIEDDNDLDVEHKFMHHCIDTYKDKVKSRDCTIYSLRDKFNHPQATIEVLPNGKVEQIKGYNNKLIEDDERVSKIKEFFEDRDEIKKTSGKSQTHQRAEEWYQGEVEWENSPDRIKYGIDEFAHGPYLESNDDDENGDFPRFGIGSDPWDDEDQAEFRKQNLSNLDIDELADKTVENIDDGINSRRTYGKIYSIEDYDFEDLAQSIVDIAYNKLDLMIDSENSLSDQYLAQRSGFLGIEDIEKYKKSRIQTILGNNPLLDLLYSFSKSYSEFEEFARENHDYEEAETSDFGDIAIENMKNSPAQIRLAIAKLIYETYLDHPVIKKFNEIFGVRFTLPEISTIEEGKYRPQTYQITNAYSDAAQLRFQDLPEGESFNLARYRKKKALADDEEELFLPDDFE